MEVFILTAFSVMVVILIILSIDGVVTNKKIKIKIDEYNERICFLKREFNNYIEYQKKREALLKYFNDINVEQFPDKLKQDFYNETILGKDGAYYRIIYLLCAKKNRISNETLKKVIDIYSEYCEKLYTLEKYSQKEKPVKRPVGRPRKRPVGRPRKEK